MLLASYGTLHEHFSSNWHFAHINGIVAIGLEFCDISDANSCSRIPFISQNREGFLMYRLRFLMFQPQITVILNGIDVENETFLNRLVRMKGKNQSPTGYLTSLRSSLAVDPGMSN